LDVGTGNRRLVAPFNPQELRGIFERMLDESEFLRPFGIRTLSRYYKD
jgi:hypothetical protein